MPRKISEETKQLMEELYNKGLSVAEIARKVNVSYATVYGYTKVKQKGFASRTEYHEHLAKQKGFASYGEYRKYQAEQRQQKKSNQKLSGMIKQSLEKLGRNQRWLAEQLRITEGAVSRYISGKTKPRKSLQDSLFRILDLQYQTLDDLVESDLLEDNLVDGIL